jgi:tetratricopeptide (TPR) repeat protein
VGQARGSVGAAASTAAYEAYLKGRYHWGRRTREGFRLAVEWYERAIAEDPAYARAYAGLSDVYSVLPAWSIMPAAEAFAKGEPYARRALDLDPNLAEAHASLGAVLSNKYADFVGAERELRRALELDPGYTIAQYWLGTALVAQDRVEEAEAAMERSRQMDPMSVVVVFNLAALSFRLRRYDRALDGFRETLELDPTFLGAYMPMAQVHACRGTWDEGIAYLSGLDPTTRQSTEVTGALAVLHARAGHAEESRALLRQLEERSAREYVTPMFRFHALYALGEKEEALRLFDRGLRSNDIFEPEIRGHPTWDEIRADPPFAEVIRAFHLEREAEQVSRGGAPS